MEKSTKVRAKNPAVFGRKAATSVLAVAMAVLLLPAPALAGDNGLGLAASTAQTLAGGMQATGGSTTASSDTPSPDAQPATNADADSPGQQTSQSDAAATDATPSTEQSASVDAGQSANATATDQTLASQNDSSAATVAPTATDTNFFATITIGGKSYSCTFGIMGDTTAQIGNGFSSAVDASASGAVSIPATIKDPFGGGTYTIIGIGGHAFQNCKNITSTGLADAPGITALGDYAFAGCTSLTDTGLAGNTGLRNIRGNYVFQGCTSLTDTGLGSNNTLAFIHTGMFQDCTSLTTTGLATNTLLNSLGISTFQGCTSLTDTGLGGNKTLAGLLDCCFKGCTALIHAAAGVANFSGTPFDSDSSLQDVCCFGTLPSTYNSWEGSIPSITLYYMAGERGWSGIQPGDIVRRDDSLKALSKVDVTNGSITNAPQKCYWSLQPSLDSSGCYMQGDKLSLSPKGATDFLRWYSDDSTGSFSAASNVSSSYTVGIPVDTDKATISALNAHFTLPLQIGGKNYDCEYKVTNDSSLTVEVSNEHNGEIDHFKTAIDPDAQGSFTIPDSVDYGGKTYAVTSICQQAFIDCSGITNTGLAGNTSVTTIGQGAYISCSSLTSTDLGSNNSVKTLGDGVFNDCTALTSTGLGSNSSVVSLGSWEFADCTALTDTGLSSNTTLTSLGGSETFKNCFALVDTGLGSNASLYSLSSWAFERCVNLKNTGLASNKHLYTIDSNAFNGCTSLNDTGLANNDIVATIRKGAFSGCTSLVHAAIGENVRNIEAGCFNGDTALTDLCFYGNWAPSSNTWLGTLSSTPITLYYVAPNWWNDKTASEVARAGDSLKELSQLKVSGGSTSTSPASYWGKLANTPAYGYYAQGEQISIAVSGNVAFLNWVSDDSTGKFNGSSSSSTTSYTIGAPLSGTTTLTALSPSFKSTITIGGQQYDCTYVIDGNGNAQIGDGTGPAVNTSASGGVVLPRTVHYNNHDYDVKRIANSAFKGCSAIKATGLDDANSIIESIGDNAFQDCTDLQETGFSNFSTALKSVGAGAFQGCTSLTKTGFNENSSVTQVGAGAFQGCTSLTKTDFNSNDSFNFIGSDAFKDCTGLTLTGLENVSITGIGSGAFQGCTGLTDTGMACDTKVTSIGDNAFAATGIQNADIGSAVVSFGDACFDGDDLSGVCFYGNVPPQDTAWLGSRKNGSNVALYYLSEHTGWSGKTALTLTGVAGDSLKALSRLNEEGAQILTQPSSAWPIELNDDMKGRYAQGDKVSIVASAPASFLRWISDDSTGSFADETSSSTTYTVGVPMSDTAKITALTPQFSATLQVGGANTTCTYVASNDGTAQIGNGTSAAIDTAKAGDMTLPATVGYGGKTYTVKSLAANAFKDCAHITSTGLASNSSVTSMGNAAFSGCTALAGTGLESNTAVTSMGQGSFQGCTSLANTGLAANNTLKAIAQNAFQGCTALASTGLAANASVILVDANAFNGCTALTDTGLGANAAVTTVGAHAFQDCTGLASTGLATNTYLTSLGQGAFQGCTVLADTGLASNTVLTALGDSIFAGCKALKATGLSTNSHVTTVGQGTFSDCTDLADTGLAANKTVASIGANAFLNCTALTDTGLESNSTVTSLDAGVFKGCIALAHAGIGSGITSMGKGCFDGDTALKDVCFYGSPLVSGGATWLGAPSAAPVTVYYLAENPTWHKKALTDVARAGDSLKALSHLAVVGGTVLASPSCYWASVPGVTSGCYAQGDSVPIMAADPSTFLLWSSDDASASFASASAATTMYTIGAPLSGIANLAVTSFVPAPPDNPSAPGNGSDDNGTVDNDGSSSQDSGLSGDGSTADAAASNSATAPGAGSDATPSQQSNGDWYSSSNSSHGDSSDSSKGSSASANEGAEGILAAQSTTAAGLALGTVLAAVLVGLLLIRRHK